MSEPVKDVFIARQPIYNRQLEIVAYELLFRRSRWHTQADIIDADDATSQVILNTFLEFGLDNLVGRYPAYINLTRSFLLGKYKLPLNPERVVLEVLEDIEVNDELIAGIRHLSERGFTIALDDFVYRNEYAALVDIAHIVKIDLLSLDRDSIAEHVELLRKHKVLMVAEKVETVDDLAFCQALDFDCYQGFYFAKPKTITGQKIPTNRPAILKVLALSLDRNTPKVDLEERITQDISLSYKLLNYINTSGLAPDQRITSVQQALTSLSPRDIRNWMSLIALSDIKETPDDLVLQTMIRAKMCQLLAEAAERSESERYFTVGLFSSLGVLLGLPLEEALDTLPLSQEIRNALLHDLGDMGQALVCTLQHECDNVEENKARYADLPPDTINTIFLRAIAWARESYLSLTE